MPISSDVNTIFAYIDKKHKFHIAVALFIVPYKRKDVYVLLDEVKSRFIYTYSAYLKEACLIIEKSIIDYKAKRSKLLPNPTPFMVAKIIDSEIKKRMKQVSEMEYFNYDATTRFVNKMLTEYSVLALYEEEEKLAEFREKYLVKSEEESSKEITRFLDRFKDFEVVNFNDITSFCDWLDKLKKVDLDVFKRKQDIDDMRIAAQFLGYNQEKGRLSFFTCDFEFYRSLGLVSKHFNQGIGKLFPIPPR